jgi:hypothetical protein
LWRKALLVMGEGYVLIRHPGQVPHSGMRAGTQNDLIFASFLDSGSRPISLGSPGMTAFSNCDTASGSGGAMTVGVIDLRIYEE